MDDAGALEIPSTLLVWVIVLALSVPPIAGAAESALKARAALMLASDARELATLASRAYEGASEDTRIGLDLQLPPKTDFLTMGMGTSSAHRTLVLYKVQGGSVGAMETTPEVEIWGEGCRELRLGPGHHALRLRYAGSACGTARVVLVEAGG